RGHGRGGRGPARGQGARGGARRGARRLAAAAPPGRQGRLRLQDRLARQDQLEERRRRRQGPRPPYREVTAMAPERTEERERAGGVLAELPTDALVAEIGNLAGALGERAASSLGGKVESATGRLTEYAKNGGGTPLLGAGLAG